MSDEITKLKEAEKQSNGQFAAPPATHHRRPEHKANWGAGIVLIVIGLVFLLANTTNLHLNNWWALFILIPAVANFGNAWRDYQHNGRFTRSGRGSITGGLILTLIAATFLFGWSWGLIWPLFLIIGGISALMGGWFD